MEEVLIESLIRIADALEVIAIVLAGIFLVQVFSLLFKDKSGGYYLRQIHETLKVMINKIR